VSLYSLRRAGKAEFSGASLVILRERMSRALVWARLPRRTSWIAVTILVLAAATALLPSGRQWYEQRNDPKARLVAATGDLPYRLSVARFTGGFPYKPLPSVRRGAGNEPHVPGQWKILQVLANIEHSTSVTDFRVRAVAHAFLARPEQAVSDLEWALQSATHKESPADAIQITGDAELLIDLAAAYSMRAHKRDDPSDYLSAIAAADRAVMLAPTSLEALWNRSVAIEGLGLIPEARTQWARYLERDSHTSWANEARERLHRLSVSSDADTWDALRPWVDRAIARGDRAGLAVRCDGHAGRLRAIVDRELFPRLITAAMQGDGTSVMAGTKAIAVVGDVLVSLHGERLVANLARSITHASDSDLRAFALPHADYFALEEARISRKQHVDISSIRTVVERLDELQSPFAIPVRLQIAGVLFSEGRFEEVIEITDALAERWSLREYRAEEAQRQWLRGLAYASLGQFDDAIRAYHFALVAFQAIRDHRYASAVELLIAEVHELIGRHDQAFREYSRSVADLDRAGDRRRAVLALTLFGRAAMRYADPGAALFIQQAVIDRIRQSDGEDAYLCDALITRCRTAARVGRTAEARKACNDASRVWAKVDDPSSKAQLQADLFIGLAAVAETSGAAIEYLDQAVSAATRRRDEPRMAQTLLLRARSRNDLSLARHDLEQAISIIERRRSKLGDDMDRISYFDTVSDVYRELTRVLLRAGNAETAFDVLEQSRARVLIEQSAQATSGSAAPLPLHELLQRVPASTALLVYWIDGNALYIWVLRNGTWQVHHQIVNIAELTMDVHALLSSLNLDKDWDRPAAKRLWKYAMEPVEKALIGTSSIVIVGDGPLSELPFAILVADNDTLLIEHFAVIAAPSATTYMQKTMLPPTTLSSAVLVAGPDLPRESDLPRLEHGEEVAAVEASFPFLDVLSKEKASPAHLIDAATRVDVVHVGVHATDAEGGLQPALHLTPDATHADGILRATEIRSGHIRPGALIVLAACRTARGAPSAEGMLSITRAFLAAGARTVVSTYWDTPDESTGVFFRHFYAALKADGTVSDAVRTAQLALLNNPRFRSPRFWSPYQAHGGN
jgi:CHAT domain-containing protein